MAKHRFGKKKGRKSSKRAAAARKAWRTRKRRYGTAGKKRGGRKTVAHHRAARKNPRRVAAGRKAWRTKVRRYGSKAAALRATFGKRRGKRK